MDMCRGKGRLILAHGLIQPIDLIYSQYTVLVKSEEKKISNGFYL